MTHNPYAPPESEQVSASTRSGDSESATARVLKWSPMSLGGGVAAGWICATFVYPRTIEFWQGFAINGFIFGLCLAVGVSFSGGIQAAMGPRRTDSGVVVTYLLLVLTSSISFALSRAFPRSLLIHLLNTQPWLFAVSTLFLPMILRLCPVVIFLQRVGLLTWQQAFWFVIAGCIPAMAVYSDGIYDLLLERYVSQFFWIILQPALFHAIMLSLLAVWLRRTRVLTESAV